jgi:linoleoyl-CoA desaturase
MKTLKFVAHNEQEKKFATAVRNNVNAYFKDKGISQKGNWTMLVQTMTMLGLYLIPFAVILLVPMPIWLAIILTIVMGVGMAGIGMCVMHDAVHGSYSNKAWVNKLFGATLYLLGSNVLNWKMQHNLLHHTYTNIEGYDQDIGSRGPIRLSQFAPLKKIHKYQYIHAFFFYGLMTISKLIKDFTQLINFNREGFTKLQRVNPRFEYAKMIVINLSSIKKGEQFAENWTEQTHRI